MTQEEQKRRMLQHIQVAQWAIEPGFYPNRRSLDGSVAWQLRAMLEAMTGLGAYGEGELYPSIFSPEVTEAIRTLLSTIDQKKEALVSAREFGLAH